MITRRARLLLWITAAAFLAAAGSVIALHALHPPRVQAPGSRSNHPGSEPIPDRQTVLASPDAEALRLAASHDIRQRLFDPPVVTPKPPPPKPLPPVELISTIIRAEGDASAWVRDGSAVKKVTVGSTVGPENNTAVVVAIERDRLVLEHEGVEAEVTIASTGGRRP